MDDKPSSQPPPIPPQPLQYASGESAKPPATYSEYDRVADKVGFVPNVRAKDNLYQLIAGAIGIVIGVVVAVVMQADTVFYVAFGITGFIVGAVGYGIYLGIVGLFRGKPSRK